MRRSNRKRKIQFLNFNPALDTFKIVKISVKKSVTLKRMTKKLKKKKGLA